MANYREDFADVELQTGKIYRNFMNQTIGSGDALGDRFGVHVFRDGEPVTLGGSCAGYFVRNATGETIVISGGVVSENEAYVTLPAACYAVEGSFTLAIKVTSGDEVVTLRIVDGMVDRTNTSVIVDPGNLVPSIEDLIDAIDAAVASIPADYSSLWTSLAPAFSTSVNYTSGQYVTYNGAVYQFTVDHPAGTWNSAHVTATNLGSDLSSLKSAIDNVNTAIDNVNTSLSEEIATLAEENDGQDELINVLQKNLEETNNHINDVVALKNVYVVDNDHNHIIDSSGNRLLGLVYLPITDDTFISDIYPPTAFAVGDKFNRVSFEIDNLKDKTVGHDASIADLTAGLAETNDNLVRQGQEIDQLTNDTVALEDIYIVDNDGNYIIESTDNKLTGKAYLPIIDNTLESDIYPAAAADLGELKSRMGKTFLDGVGDITYKGWNDIPTLYIDNMSQTLLDFNASKASGTVTDATYRFPAFGISGNFSKVKIQGNSSQTFPKKNYTLTFDRNIKFVDSWGYHKKYVIKSNFNDFTQARNVCCAKLWGQERITRIGENSAYLVDENADKLVDNESNYLVGDIDPQLASAINCGAVDGFPIMVYMNDEYWGLYCFNTPKDDFMANMGDGTTECILSSDTSSTQAEYFKGLATMTTDANGYYDFELEYASDDFSEEAILTSLNRMLDLVINTHENYVDTLSPYIDFGSAIDYYILCALIDNLDGIGKNYLLQTWDGVKWYFCAYDMDMVLGNINSRGNVLGYPAGQRSFNYLQTRHRMFHIIYAYCRAELIARYRALRNTVFSENNVDTLFGRFMMKIPKNAYDYETVKWPQTTGTFVKTYDQICNWYRLRVQYLDAEIDALEETLT